MSQQYVIVTTSEITEIKRSKFIAYLMPYYEFDNMMTKLREEHSKARHFVYAYRRLNEFNQVEENQSDDGEPKGSSGKPSLAAMRGANLINTAVIIVRYFGGIKLGVGGLVRAYSTATNNVINVSEMLAYKRLKEIDFLVTYSHLAKVEHSFKEFATQDVLKEFLADNVKITLKLPEEEFIEFQILIKDLVEFIVE